MSTFFQLCYGKGYRLDKLRRQNNSDKTSEKTDTVWTGRTRSWKSKRTVFRLSSVKGTTDKNDRETFGQRASYRFHLEENCKNNRDT